MDKLKAFLNTIQETIYSPKFYSKVTIQPFRPAFNYFLLLALGLTLIHILVLSPILLKQAPDQVNTLVNQALISYPDELKVQIHQGLVTTNVTQPYFIAIPNTPASGSAAVSHLMVIDTKTPYSLDQFQKYSSYVWLTRDSVAYYSSHDSGDVKIASLNKVQEFNLDKTALRNLADRFRPWLILIGPGLLLLSGLGLYLGYLIRLIYLLILALLIWLIAKLFKHQFSYSHSYKFGLYAISLGLILELITNLIGGFGFGWGGVPFLVSLVTLLVAIFNLKTKSSS